MAPDTDDSPALLRRIADEVFGSGVWSADTPSQPISSVDMMRFLVRIERGFGIVVPDNELRAENFASFGSILEMIDRSRA